VELKDREGRDLARAGEEWDGEGAGEGAVVTEREERLRDEIGDILSGGPDRGFEKIAGLGELFVRDRLDLVFDEIAHEDGTFARHADDAELPADGLVTGIGVIDGRKVAFTANDYTVKAGSLGGMGVEKVVRIQERAMDLGIPMLRLVDSTGARLNAEERDPGDTHMDRYRGGRMFYNQCVMSGQVPRIGVLYGPDVAGSAYTPVFCDFLLMVEDTAGMAIASPRIVRAMTGEEVDMESLGGPEVHARHSGSADLVVPDEAAAAERVRELVGLLPQDYTESPPAAPARPPAKNPGGLDAVIPEEPDRPYDVHGVIE